MPGDFTRASARQSLSQYFARHARPDFQALVAANDETAIGAIEALREHGCSVPRDVSVIGFDNIPDAQFVVPSITTVGQRLIEQGRTAATMAAALARGEAAPREIVLPARLILRTSCGCLPATVAALDALPTGPGRAGPSAMDAAKIVEQSLPEQSPAAIRRNLNMLAAGGRHECLPGNPPGDNERGGCRRDRYH